MNVLEDNPSGYQHSVYEIEKVLGSGFLKCSCCKANLTAYRNKLKNIFYYKCEHCKTNANAITTLKSRNKGLNTLFEELLSGWTLPLEFQKMVTSHLSTLFASKNNGSDERKKSLKSRLEECKQQKKEVQLKLGYSKITQEIYDITSADIEVNIAAIEKELYTLRL